MKLWDGASGDAAKQRAIATQAFDKVGGRYELDLSKPIFKEVHKRDHVARQGWKKVAKPRDLWAMELMGAGGSCFFKCCDMFF